MLYNDGEYSVTYSSEGHPDFSPFEYPDSSKGHADIGSFASPKNKLADFAAANRKVGFSETPAGYTWHHSTENGKLTLVRTDVHNHFGHQSY